MGKSLLGFTGLFILILAVEGLCPSNSAIAEGNNLPIYLMDRGTGISTSMFGTYIRGGELIVYPFFEYYLDKDMEYKPSELGYGLEQDFRGKYRASEGILFIGYGLNDSFAFELEAAVITAEQEKSDSDPSTMPDKVKESGLGDVEGQVRWRLLGETENRPEVFTYFETVFPLQKNRKLIGTQDWEFKLGAGIIRGYRWGTMTLRAAGEYTMEEKKFDAGEYAVEYLKRLSPAWRVVAVIEGDQVDEVAFITEVQWHFRENAFFKINNGFGLTTNAVDFAPEVGVLFTF